MSLDKITSDALSPLKHGFFTRKGGVSLGIYEGLNCGAGSHDDPHNVATNKAQVAAEIGVHSDHLHGVYQIHSPDVLVLEEPVNTGTSPTPPPKADALVTKVPGLALSVLSADCQPVLFADHTAKIIGAAHAGWKGAMNGVLEATLDAMVDLGAKRQDIQAVIGPCISQRAYEVGPEFVENFIDTDPEYSRFFAGGTAGHAMFDLPSFGLHRLREAGVAQAQWVGHCTYNDPKRFYSYRRSCHQNEPDYGRLIAAIRL